jgi:hypothetical protein
MRTNFMPMLFVMVFGRLLKGAGGRLGVIVRHEQAGRQDEQRGQEAEADGI